ncbi:hypothetical protein KFK09_020656 [Dendrobium nobile]|uniref:CCHC-type domain-containing protein n=1 Tax=Dendrobium nobile TaxID=94219 RepID=A0A8T3ANS9_DENNO|nr:hypothetical protein KFK09_020656 [Dendrobium nobile]
MLTAVVAVLFSGCRRVRRQIKRWTAETLRWLKVIGAEEKRPEGTIVRADRDIVQDDRYCRNYRPDNSPGSRGMTKFGIRAVLLEEWIVTRVVGEKDMDPPAESSVPNEQHSAAPMPSESMMQLATAIAHVMGDAQSKMSGSKEEEVDRHLQMFHKLKPPLFKGAVGPQAAEDWIMRVEKIFDSMQCPGNRKVPLAVFMLESEAERWWIGQQREKFQGKTNAEITWDEFTTVFRMWFVPPSAQRQMQEAFMRLEQGHKSVMEYEAEFTALARYAAHLIPTAEEKCYRFLHGLNRELRHPLVPFRIHEFSELVERARLIEIDLATPVPRYEDTRRRRDEVRRDDSGRDRDREKRSRYESSRGSASGSVPRSASVVSSGSSGACVHCGKRHAGRCYLLTGQCFHCGQQGHRAAACPQKGLGGRTDSGTGSGQQRTVGPRTYSERSGNRIDDRAVRDQRETVAPRPPALPPVVPRIYSLQSLQHQDQQRPESSTEKEKGKKRKSWFLETAERFSSDAAVGKSEDLVVRAREQEIGIDPDLQMFVRSLIEVRMVPHGAYSITRESNPKAKRISSSKEKKVWADMDIGLGRSVKISEDRPGHRPVLGSGRLKFDWIILADLTIIQAD